MKWTKKKTNFESWNYRLGNIKKCISKDAAKHALSVTQLKGEHVPTMAELRQARDAVKKALYDDLSGVSNLNYRTLKGLNFFYLQSVLSVRPKVLLDITLEVYRTKLRKGGIVFSNDHKTGAKYTIAIKLPEEQIQFLDTLTASYELDTGHPPKYLFSAKGGKQETSISFVVNDELKKLENGVVLSRNYGATAIRKTWDRYFKKSKHVNTDLYEDHLRQCGHSQGTSNEFYTEQDDDIRVKLLQQYNAIVAGEDIESGRHYKR